MRRKPNNKMGNNGNHHNRRRHRGDNNAGKIKSASANRDKYLNLARDAMASGDRVEAENYLQHAEHYFRVLSSLQEEDNRHRERHEQQFAAESAESSDVEDGAKDGADDAEARTESKAAEGDDTAPTDDSLALAS